MRKESQPDRVALMARRSMVRWVPLAVIAAALVWHSLQYNFVTDDAYISFVYARNFAEHGQLVFNTGMPPVEGYTNFLWTIMLGALMVVGISPTISSLWLGTGFAIGTLVVAFRLTQRLFEGNGERSSSAWDYVAPALLAASSGFACWSSGGLETQMFTFWVALALYLYTAGDSEPRRLRGLGVVLALAAMTRPEGLLVAGVLGLHRLALNLVRDRRLRPHTYELLCMAGFLALWLPWFLWRWKYYGYPFPNTYYVKAAGDAPAGYHETLFENGLYYVGQWLAQTKLLYGGIIAVLGLAISRPRTPRFVFGTAALLLALLYLAYTVKVGGDFMGLHRFVMPLFFIAAMGMVLGFHLIIGKISSPRWQPFAATLVVLVMGGFVWSQLNLTQRSTAYGNWAADHGIDTPAFLDVYAHDRAAIGRHMKSCFAPDDFSIVGGAGAQPYHGHMRAIDVFGLVSERIAHEVPPTRPRAGHNKWGPTSLLAEYEPEFVFSCYSIHADPGRPRLNCNPATWRNRGYKLMTLYIPEMIQKGDYYTFLIRADRARTFECEGIP